MFLASPFSLGTVANIPAFKNRENNQFQKILHDNDSKFPL
jgi:hypothetical protein